jgi:hypothetical protein
MKFRLSDSLAAFVKAKGKYVKRYGKPEGSGQASDYLENEDWETTRISLIWVINEFESILLTHSHDGTVAEFQDVSVCQ